MYLDANACIGIAFFMLFLFGLVVIFALKELK